MVQAAQPSETSASAPCPRTHLQPYTLTCMISKGRSKGLPGVAVRAFEGAWPLTHDSFWIPSEMYQYGPGHCAGALQEVTDLLEGRSLHGQCKTLPKPWAK